MLSIHLKLWSFLEPTGNKCPECGELLLKKITKNGKFETCSSRTCNYRVQIEEQETTFSAED